MIRWKRNPRPTGLAGACCGVQGSTLLENSETELASTQATGKWWFWYARHEDSGGEVVIPLINTCGEPVETEKQAKADARAYVRKHLGR